MSQDTEEERPKSAARLEAERPPLSDARLAEFEAAAADPARAEHVRRTVAMGEAYKNAIATNPRFANAITAMVTLRRAYSVAFKELIDSIGEGGPDEEALLDYAIQYAMHRAAQPFDEREMLHAALTEVFPWFAHLSNERLQAEKERALAEAPQREAARRAHRVPIGVYHHDTDDSATLERSKSLILVGWAPALRFLSYMALADATNQSLRAVQLTTKDNPKPSLGPVIKEDRWRGFGNAEKKVLALFKAAISEYNTIDWDLIVCDDLVKASTAGFVGQAPAATAGNTQKHIRSWCTKNASAFIGCLPQNEMITDITGPEYEQLKVFSYLRQVVTRRHDDKYYSISVGSAEPLLVAIEVINDFDRPRLIVPGGS